MLRKAQDLASKNTEESRIKTQGTLASAPRVALRDPYGFGTLLASLREPANDDADLDALLDTLDDAIPADDPTPAPVCDLVTKPAPKTRRLKRASGLRQREDARRMRALGQPDAEEVVEHLPPPSSTPQTHNKTTAENSAKATTTITTGATYRRGIASWKDAGELPRIIAINRAVADLGVPFAFSVNFDPKLIRAGNANERGLLDYLRRRVALELKRATGRAVPMWVVVETDDDGLPHLHGGLALNDNDRPDVIEEALAKAGGNWTRQGSAPADVRRQWNADGWSAYPLKRMARTRRHLREASGLAPGAHVPLYAVTKDLRAAGERIHDEERKRIGRR